MCTVLRGRDRAPDVRADQGPVLGRAPMVVFPPVVHFHVPGRAADRAAMARVRIFVLPQGARVFAKRPQTEGAEGRQGQAGVRGDLFDRSQGLGWRTHFRANHHWTHSSK